MIEFFKDLNLVSAVSTIIWNETRIWLNMLYSRDIVGQRVVKVTHIVSQPKKHFIWKVHSIKQLWLEIFKKNIAQSQLPCYIYIICITILGRTEFEHPIFSIYSSQSCFVEMDPFIKNVLFCWDTKKCNIFKISEHSL